MSTIFLRHFQFIMKAVLVATLALACMLGLALGQGYYGYGGQEESSSGGSKLHCFFNQPV